jgi:predicted DNA-binding transcriptional regulator YafY
MPVDKQVLLRYQVLNKCFRNRYREYTIDDLVDECNKALRRIDKPDISKRTIQNDINILEADYGIILNEKLKRGRQRLYRYADTSYTIPLYRIDDEERNKIEDAIYVLKQFEGEPLYDWVRTILMQIEGGMFEEDASPVVSFQSNLDLKGLGHFSKLLQAILNKRVLKLRYVPYGKSQITATVYPYYLKQYNDRWYLIARVKGYDSFAHYALDRINSFEEIALPYKEAEVDFSEYFDDVIGVTVPDGDAEDIVIKVTGKRFNYIRTKPLHLSQRIIEEAEGYAIISINVKVNKELESLILSFGDDMEVISPTSFRDRIAEKIQAMNQRYLKRKDE